MPIEKDVQNQHTKGVIYMIRVVALDIYGTVLAANDPDNELPPRTGIGEFFSMCRERGVKVVSASDADTENVKIDLVESGVDTGWFDRFYRLNQLPHKDFSGIIGDYDILPEELLVIGDSDKDIGGAIRIGACYLRVPEYFEHLDGFDFRKIEF